MARITVAGGPSDARALPGEVGYIIPTDTTEVPPSAAEGGYAAASGLVDLTPPAHDFASMTLAALRELAKERGLGGAGSKAELAQRLAEQDAAGSGDA